MPPPTTDFQAWEALVLDSHPTGHHPASLIEHARTAAAAWKDDADRIGDPHLDHEDAFIAGMQWFAFLTDSTACSNPPSPTPSSFVTPSTVAPTAPAD